MRRLAILATVSLGLLACGTVASKQMPGIPPHPVVDGRPIVELQAPADSTRLTAVFSGFYADHVGVDPRDAPVAVHWTAELPIYLGLTWTSEAFGCTSWIMVGRQPSVLAHELGHCARWMLTGDGDGDHLDIAWWGDDGLVWTAVASVR